jgi:hypothetical protein
MRHGMMAATRRQPGKPCCQLVLKRLSLRILLEQIAFKTPAPALTAQVNCAYA